ncbi:MAG: hypothetical protein K9J13_10030 [Saprospiraceae bacterium]|nr:hypothetical protein [Saprospiraceae bacterium]
MIKKNIHIKLNVRILLLLSVCLLCTTYLSASSKNSEALKLYEKNANILFNQSQYSEAFPLYSHLVSLEPDNPEYCYRFAVCILISGKENAANSIDYLELASEKIKNRPLISYYLGLAHHFNYEFQKAFYYYSEFKQKVKSKESEKYKIDLKIEMCKNGEQIENSQNSFHFIEKKIVKEERFYRSYESTTSDYRLILKPDNLKTAKDRKANKEEFVCFSEDNQVMYFSSYGKNEKTGKDLYRCSKLPNGEWTKAQKLSSVINTEYDEDYPYMSPDGKAFYFCSKGHNSIGGYDIFMATFDPVNYRWSKPVNINSLIGSNLINTPFDELMFIPNPDSSYAYFSTTKNSRNGFVCYYKIVQKNNLNMAFNEYKENDKNNNQNEIEFANYKNFNSSSSNNYTINDEKVPKQVKNETIIKISKEIINNSKALNLSLIDK